MQSHLFSNIFSLKRDDFNNLAHYEIYKQLLNHLKKNKKAKIIKTENYAVFVMADIYSTNYYVLGFDKTTNKYFINKIEISDGWLIKSDKDVFKLMYYDYDCDIENINVISADGRYRVQGDLVIVSRPDVDYITRIIHSIKARLHTTLEDIIISRIVNLIVSEMNLDVMINFNHVIIRVDDKKLKRYTIEQLRDVLINKLFELLNEYKEILFNDIISFLSNNTINTESLSFNKTNHDITIECELMKIILSINIDDMINGMYNVDISISTNFNFDNIVNNVLNSLEFRTFETMFGRHKLVFENVIPNNLQVKIKLNLRERECIILDINTLNMILVRGKIIIMHPEHGTKEIVLDTIKAVSIDSVRNDLDRETNAYTLLSLLKKSKT
ncbi:MAG: hypothetical protein QXX12_02480 [Nanopusillaceae archaeon]